MDFTGISSKGVLRWRSPAAGVAFTKNEAGTTPLIPHDQIDFLKENMPIIKKLLPSEGKAPLGKPSIFKQDTNVPLVATGADVLQQLGLTGKDLAVAVLDSGVADVPDLHDNLIASYRVKDGDVIRSLPGDPLGHGTAVAGFIAGTGKQSGGVYRGMAPDAKIVSVQVANEHGGGRYSDLPAAIHFLVKNKNNFKDNDGNPVPLRVINISMGFPEFLPTKSDPMARAVREAWKEGIVVVAAAGNEGRPERGMPFGTIFGAPGDEPMIIVAGAVDDRGTPDRSKAALAEFSSWGPTPEGADLPTLCAPGANVVSVNVPGSMFDRTARASDSIREMKDDDLYQLLQQDDELRENLEVKPEELALSTPQEIHKEVNEHLPSIRLINDYHIALSGTSFASPITAGGVAQLIQWMVQQGNYAGPDSVKAPLVATSEKLSGVPKAGQGAGYVNFKKAYDRLQSGRP